MMKSELVWRKSRRSGSSGGQCVEVANLENKVAVRDSKDPHGPMLVVSRGVLRDALRLAAERSGS
ncbi:DUF397 domain-containing protein [Actinomadura sp. 7K534]|uniref:DUF397 domain-containing protein n=1 Tax=Actinomadura sp. 7K534 TaxID=2530366 RepID=UPI00104E76D4|nr:DUF397 domain-containing protein [Actinomadura sp. 7K534]TDB98660.1 DUF397 domain-containing protein [Actinomadura sp. 7K534]